MAVTTLIHAHLAARESIQLVPDDYSPSCQSHQQEFSLLDQMMISSERQPPRLHEKLLAGDQQGFFIYDRPVSIPSNLPDHPESHAIVLISILFNLGLAQHLCAMELCPTENCAKRQEMTMKALKLYRLAFQLHHSNQLDQTGSGVISRPSNMLLLALMNNSGHTYHLLGEIEDSGKCFQHLFASLMWLRSTNWWQARSHSKQLSPEKLFAGFSDTTATWLLGNLSNMAAAAA